MMNPNGKEVNEANDNIPTLTTMNEKQTPNQPSPPVGQAKLTRKELKARGACYYCKNKGHYSRMPQEASRPTKEESSQA
jgi:hypothetical protein